MYDFPPYRPPNEAESALIRITRGCPWNRCAFCFMYKDIRFEAKPLEEIRKDVSTARQVYKSAESIFLGDSDNLVHKELPEIVKVIRETFPEAKRITAYARDKSCLKITLDVRESNRGAIDLYNKFGFKIAGRRKKYYRFPVEDSLIMEKILL